MHKHAPCIPYKRWPWRFAAIGHANFDVIYNIATNISIIARPQPMKRTLLYQLPPFGSQRNRVGPEVLNHGVAGKANADPLPETYFPVAENFVLSDTYVYCLGVDVPIQPYVPSLYKSIRDNCKWVTLLMVVLPMWNYHSEIGYYRQHTKLTAFNKASFLFPQVPFFRGCWPSSRIL